MFTELEFDKELVEEHFDEMLTRSLNILCSDSMFILQNNSKVLRYLTESKLSEELDMLVSSVRMAIKRNRFELVQNIILGLKGHAHKLAALEIKYFDEYNTLLRSDVYSTFMPQNMLKHAFVPPALKEIFVVFNSTAQLSPTNAAFALRTSLEVGEQNFVKDVLLSFSLTPEFISQIKKRYHDNFGMTIEEDLENRKAKISKTDVIRNFLRKAM